MSGHHHSGVSATHRGAPAFRAVVVVALLLSGAALAAQGSDTIGEIRVHGNHTTPDADVIALSGLSTGSAATDAQLREAENKLKTSHRFDDVEVRRRFRSIDNPSDILVVILVNERAGVSADNPTPGVFTRFGAATQWIPILGYEDGYGLTYGIQIAVNDVIGDRSRVSVPLTWGGERRAGLQVERAFTSGPISFVRVGTSINRRVNPFFDVADQRRDIGVEVARALKPWLRVGGDASVAHVEFGPGYEGRHTSGGAHLALDTRLDPSFPRNAIYTRVAWQRLAFPAGAAGRWTTDARGYVGIGGPLVLALRGQIVRSDAAVPAAEQVLLGGSGSLRGYRAGYRAGDSMAAVSAEARLPLISSASLARFGVKGFVDAGTVWSSGQRLADQRFARGVGGGVYLGAVAFILDLDVAWPEQGDPRVHVAMGVKF
jgi:outer membrane protein assembly factor BamA